MTNMTRIKIREIRKAKGLTQQDIAKMTGLSQQTISDAERGGNMNLATLVLIARALGVKVTELIEE